MAGLVQGKVGASHRWRLELSMDARQLADLCPEGVAKVVVADVVTDGGRGNRSAD
jgi:hypothetical protein